MQTIKTDCKKQKTPRYFLSKTGKLILSMEVEQLAKFLPELHGDYILQCGSLLGIDYIHSSKIKNKFFLFLDEHELGKKSNMALTLAEELPIATDSVDVIVLPHVLEKAIYPYKILQEIQRVLVKDGHIVVIGINPFSFLGIRHLLNWQQKTPDSGNLLSSHRLKNHLLSLNFEIRQNYCGFLTPRPYELDEFLFFEKIRDGFCKNYSWAYILVAKKCTIPLDPFKSIWKKDNIKINSDLAGSTIRGGILINHDK